MTRFTRATATVLLLVAAAGCASTRVRESWVAPDVQGPLSYDRIIVVFMDPNEATRRSAEEALVARLGADRAVASHTMFTAEQVQNAQSNQPEVRRQVQAAGIDGAVVMRMVGEEQRLSYTPSMTYPPYYGGFYGFYGYGWGYAYSPGYLSTDTIVSVETNLYDLEEDELVWAGVTETFNPSAVNDMVNEIADAVTDNLRQRGLLAAR